LFRGRRIGGSSKNQPARTAAQTGTAEEADRGVVFLLGVAGGGQSVNYLLRRSRRPNPKFALGGNEAPQSGDHFTTKDENSEHGNNEKPLWQKNVRVKQKKFLGTLKVVGLRASGNCRKNRTIPGRGGG